RSRPKARREDHERIIARAWYGLVRDADRSAREPVCTLAVGFQRKVRRNTKKHKTKIVFCASCGLFCDFYWTVPRQPKATPTHIVPIRRKSVRTVCYGLQTTWDWCVWRRRVADPKAVYRFRHPMRRSFPLRFRRRRARRQSTANRPLEASGA